MTSERDVTKLNERRRISRLTEYRLICTALNFYMGHHADPDEIKFAAKIHKKYKDRMDSSFLGAQRDHNGRTQYPVVHHVGGPSVINEHTTMRELEGLDHAHDQNGKCVKNRTGKKCN